MKTTYKPKSWLDGELTSRIGAVFGKPPKFGMPIPDYMEFLDNLDIWSNLPFSFQALNVYPYKEPVASFMCMGYKMKGITEFVDYISSYEGEPIIACDPLLRGKHSPYLIWYDTTREIYNERIPYLLRAWGDGKTGMITSSYRSGEALVAVPARWFTPVK